MLKLEITHKIFKNFMKVERGCNAIYFFLIENNSRNKRRHDEILVEESGC